MLAVEQDRQRQPELFGVRDGVVGLDAHIAVHAQPDGAGRVFVLGDPQDFGNIRVRHRALQAHEKQDDRFAARVGRRMRVAGDVWQS
ncbi:MAG: hypothetical protein QM811_19655 [Pirellulales bacterium]